jgi:hypothetical protein
MNCKRSLSVGVLITQYIDEPAKSVTLQASTIPMAWLESPSSGVQPAERALNPLI